MKKRIKYFFIILICIAQFASCGKREKAGEQIIKDENNNRDEISLINSKEMILR